MINKFSPLGTGLFWKSPELLRNTNICGTQKGDVYAFAIILFEICGRKGPFGLTEHEPKQIIELVRDLPLCDENEKSQPFRPDIQSLIDLENCPDYLINCIQDCWHETPEMRPDFPTIRTRLKKMRDGKSKNIMDQIMEMMEKYTNNLEDIVNERTRLLYEEKRKTEDLLNRMLPQSVAEKLTMGHGVEPVSYDSVRNSNFLNQHVFINFSHPIRSQYILAILLDLRSCQPKVLPCKLLIFSMISTPFSIESSKDMMSIRSRQSVINQLNLNSNLIVTMMSE